MAISPCSAEPQSYTWVRAFMDLQAARFVDS
jgi:hypothetical protein